MTDLERLDEAMAGYETAAFKSEVVWDQRALVDAARAYRNLLANGEREEPDYEAALDMLIQEDSFDARGLSMTGVRKAVDAAVGGRLLVDPPKEEERSES